MTNYQATVKWQRNSDDFLANKYSRCHEWVFDGGAVVLASASPDIVPSPWSVEARVDPEEAFVASISSCHMLFFLSIACRSGFQVESYADEAVGEMTRNEVGKYVVSKVSLNPVVNYSGEALPNHDDIESMHHEAHAECFIANSIRTKVEVNL
ncbi:MAG: OsmC family protein [Gammaproteobacteria bacterium]|nr:OsmC family protein [Gammaproteobacteria bacterium]MDD9895177.1 OsmC family protein [Gammaproteobacteria bacterium]MDD9960168.1 OsmC family protein [Gammaproteobacteria bacterium]